MKNNKREINWPGTILLWALIALFLILQTVAIVNAVSKY